MPFGIDFSSNFGTIFFYNQQRTHKSWADTSENKQIKQVIKPVAIAGDHLMGVGPKVDGGFTENMQRIAAAHPDSPMSERWGGDSRTHKEIKTRNAINKHAKTVAREGFSANKGKTLADK